jgi:glucose-6-phosphate isomerase
MAYLNRETDSQIIEIRESLESRLGIPTTFGWGPRFLHSTGQFHKGGPLVGTFLQITSDSHIELEIPGAGYGFERLVLAQALGDNEALASRGLKVIRIHLKERRAGINQLISAIAEV